MVVQKLFNSTIIFQASQFLEKLKKIDFLQVKKVNIKKISAVRKKGFPYKNQMKNFLLEHLSKHLKLSKKNIFFLL